jgi:hypothetical protein
MGAGLPGLVEVRVGLGVNVVARKIPPRPIKIKAIEVMQLGGPLAREFAISGNRPRTG